MNAGRRLRGGEFDWSTGPRVSKVYEHVIATTARTRRTSAISPTLAACSQRGGCTYFVYGEKG